MDENPSKKYRLAAAVVAVVVCVATLIGGGIALAGASDSGGSTTDPVGALDSVDVLTPIEIKTAAPVSVPAPAVAVAQSDDGPAALIAADGGEPAGEPDCDAFFAELDAEHNANNARFAEVLGRFGVAHELVDDGNYTYVELDYDDPIAETISNSFWAQVAEDENSDLYEHPCFKEMEFEGCGEGLEYDDAFEEGAFDEYEYEMDDDYLDELDAEWEEQWEQVLAERNATLEALAAALADAGVEHEVATDYDWVSVTFDLDDERAIPVVAALR